MKKISAVTMALALLCLGSLAQANITIDTVAVGDPGNAGELSGAGAGGYGNDRICGSVGYNYNIGKYEVTAGQYTVFLNAKAKADTYGLYNTFMSDPNAGACGYGCNIQRTGSPGSYTYSVASDWANRPVNYVSYWDACRFVNWLGNGQGNGSTETGAYTLGGYNGVDGHSITRNANWKWAVTSEDEWYKAAYYKGGGTDAGYWDYPTSSNTVPGRNMADASGNNANYYYYGLLIGSPYYRTNAGEFENSRSAYGTFDQGGNVREWNEGIAYISGAYAYRVLRGGEIDSDSWTLKASWRDYSYATNEGSGFGFRVSEVPEPSSIIALAGGLVGLLGMRRRRA
jgi:sulfatase modifying factor 1